MLVFMGCCHDKVVLLKFLLLLKRVLLAEHHIEEASTLCVRAVAAADISPSCALYRLASHQTLAVNIGCLLHYRAGAMSKPLLDKKATDQLNLAVLRRVDPDTEQVQSTPRW